MGWREDVERRLRWLNRPVSARPVVWFRRVSGVLAMVYFARCLWEVPRYTAPEGLIPHELSASIFWFTWQPLFDSASSQAWCGAMLVVALIGCAVSALGDRRGALVAFVVGACLYRWNFPVLYLEDAMVHQLVFWAMLLPDARRRQSVPGAVVRLMSANMVLLYAVTGLSKWLSPMWLDGSAVWAVACHPVAWTQALCTEAPTWPMRAMTWATLALEPLLAVAVWMAPRTLARRALLVGAVGLHLGIVVMADVALANLACLAMWVVVARDEVWLDPARLGVQGPRWRWREGYAALALALLCGAMGGAAFSDEWRNPRANALEEAGQGVQRVCVSGLWLMGLAQQYRLFDWIDARDARVTREVVRVNEAGEGDAWREAPMGALRPFGARGAMMWTPLLGYRWVAIPEAREAAYADAVAERLAEARCAQGPDGRWEADVAVVQRVDRGAEVTRRVWLRFECHQGHAEQVRWTRRVTPPREE